jgi:hypothetical protein
LIFQALDEKHECVGIYLNGDVIYNDIPSGLSRTWSFSSFLSDKEIEYAQVYCRGKSLDEVCPDHLKPELERVWKKMGAFYRSFVISKIDLNPVCFYDLLPEEFLKSFCEVKNKITEHVLENYSKPKNYDLQSRIVALTTQISSQRLNLDIGALRDDLSKYKTRQFFKKINNTEPYIKYNPYGTKTGRLTTRKNSFPILTMDKKYRKIIKPNNDLFVEFDYNSAELRVLLGLSGEKQPKEDLHVWNTNNIFKEQYESRDLAKKRIFSWLYNPNSQDLELSKVYNREKVKSMYWDGKCVKTMFEREIEADEYHALNYIIQSTCSDLILQQAVEIEKMLKSKKTKIAFIIHDSIVLDYSSDDGAIISDIYKQFSKTPFGEFKTNVSAGKNFGDLKEICIQ